MGTVIRLLVCVVLLAVSGATPAGQTEATARVMREKLAHSQQVLRAIMISDYGLLDREATALLQLTRAAGWQVLNSPEYIRHSDAFQRSIEDLSATAKARDLDGAAVEYSSLVMRCYQCHRYLKGMRIAETAAPSDAALLLAKP